MSKNANIGDEVSGVAVTDGKTKTNIKGSIVSIDNGSGLARVRTKGGISVLIKIDDKIDEAPHPASKHEAPQHNNNNAHNKK